MLQKFEGVKDTISHLKHFIVEGEKESVTLERCIFATFVDFVIKHGFDTGDRLARTVPIELAQFHCNIRLLDD